MHLFYPIPDWVDFVALALIGIRHFGESSIQDTRRPRGMLEDLTRTLREPRAAALLPELRLLMKTVERFFHAPEDRAMADSGMRSLQPGTLSLRGIDSASMRTSTGRWRPKKKLILDQSPMAVPMLRT